MSDRKIMEFPHCVIWRNFNVLGPAGQKDAFDLGGHWVCTRQTNIMELIQELGIEYYPQNIEGRYLSFLHSVENSEIYSHVFYLF